MRALVVGAALAIALVRPSLGHDQWADGEDVPEYVKSSCCGKSDAHHLQPEQVHVVSGGYRVEGYREVIPEGRMQPSPDGEFWVFYRDLPNGDQSSVYCFFGPLKGV